MWLKYKKFLQKKNLNFFDKAQKLWRKAQHVVPFPEWYLVAKRYNFLIINLLIIPLKIKSRGIIDIDNIMKAPAKAFKKGNKLFFIKYKHIIDRGAIFCQDKRIYKKKFFKELAIKGTQ